MGKESCNEIKDKKKEILNRNEMLIISVLVVFLIFIPFIIGYIVKAHEWEKPISIDNWLLYYATIGGALIGGFITTVGLYITINQTRKIQIKNEEFNSKQLKIITINDQINEYKILKDSWDKFYDSLKFIEKNYNIKDIYKYNTELIQKIDDIIMQLICMEDKTTANNIESLVSNLKEYFKELQDNNNEHKKNIDREQYKKKIEFYISKGESFSTVIKNKIWILYEEKYKLPNLNDE